MTRRAALAVALIAGLAAPAAAQDAGPLVVTQVRNRYVAAPDVRVTAIDGTTGTLVGGYVGRVVEDTVLVGAAGYWLADGSATRGLRYGGLLLGWSPPADGAVRLGVRSLVGFGTATVGVPLAGLAAGPGPRGFDRDGRFRPPVGPGVARARADFIVAEPQVEVGLRLSERIGISATAGYRAVALAGRYGDRIDGATGGLAVQIGW